MRTSGILMPVTSLPSPYGIGTMGKSARDFILFLEKAGQTYWQILPVGPTSYGDSPYQSPSTFAGNPYLIDLDQLIEDGLLDEKDPNGLSWGDNPDRIDYEVLYQNRFPVLRKACRKVPVLYEKEFETFCRKEQSWLKDYSLFMALKEQQKGAAWLDWEDDLRNRNPKALLAAAAELEEEITFWKSIQFLFYLQWTQLRDFAAKHHIKIIGDMPIYVAMDSADVWASPELFWLDKKNIPVAVAGCPPDGFAPTGQLWGNPLYDWKRMKKDGFSWWIKRIAHQQRLYDVIRLDHFRGFASYYAIPYKDETAENGDWMEGPGSAFFAAIKKNLGDVPFIAEDLGFITPDVDELLAETGYPGMRVIQFAFGSRDDSSNQYLPHNYSSNCVAYTGTHDNEPILAWFDNNHSYHTDYAKEYCGLQESEGLHWGMMRTIWSSVADTTIVQLSDLLGLHNEARINRPATLGNNWVWRCWEGAFNDELANKLYEKMRIYGRLPDEA